jgi:hypothetical protein
MTGGFGNGGLGVGTVGEGNGEGQGAEWQHKTTQVPVWSCVDGCPVAELDRQQDGTSRFFTVTEWSEFDRFLYVAKPGKKERNAGLGALPVKRPDDRTTTGMGTFDEKDVQPQQNNHPTVKPVALMRHLIKLVTPPGGVVLDPFLGSGTTAVAAELEGVTWKGCELTADYLPIITARVKHAAKQYMEQQPELPLD